MMIDVKQAVQIAVAYINEFQEFIEPREIRLEETELVEPGYWEITLSLVDNPLTGHRSYKVFRIDADTGAVRSMKARAVLGMRQ
jgi:hypothetical protein